MSHYKSELKKSQELPPVQKPNYVPYIVVAIVSGIGFLISVIWMIVDVINLFTHKIQLENSPIMLLANLILFTSFMCLVSIFQIHTKHKKYKEACIKRDLKTLK